MAIQPSIACGMLECLGQVWKAGDFCDFTVVVENERIPCHRCVLGACSGYFRAVMMSGGKEQFEHSITEITKATFIVILNCVYTGQNGLTVENIIDVWRAARKLQISFLITECEKFVMEHKSASDCVVFQTYLLGVSDGINFIQEFLMRNFESFSKTDSFLKLSADTLRVVISSQDLVVASEDSVVKSVLRWVSYKPSAACARPEGGSPTSETTLSCTRKRKVNSYSETEDRRAHLATLISSGRLYLCSTKFLKMLLDLQVVNSCVRSCDLILSAIKYKTTVANHINRWPSQAVPRPCSNLVPAVLFIPWGCIRNPVKNTKICLYSLLENRECPSFELKPSVEPLRSITVFSNTLYCLSSSQLYKLNVDKTWDRLGNGHSSNCPVILVSHDDRIYLCHNDSVHESRKVYSVDPNKKTELTCLSRYCKHMQFKLPESIVSCGRYILFFSSDLGHTLVTCFDPVSKTMTQLSYLNVSSDSAISFTVKSTIYILQGNGSLYKAVNPHYGPFRLEFVSKLWDFSWPVRGAAFYMDQLFIFGHPVHSRDDMKWPTSLPGVFETIRPLQMPYRSNSYCPVLVPKSWLI